MRFVEGLLQPTQRAGKLARAAGMLVCLAILGPGPGFADDVDEDTQLQGVQPSEGSPVLTDPATLWDMEDAELQVELEAALERLGLTRATRKGQLCVALVDINQRERPRVAAVNGDTMMYAASLPKIAVLLAAFEQVAQGELALDSGTQTSLEQMIRRSSNSAATQIIHLVGKENIARILSSPRYRLYDPEHNGGLWVGKDYAKGGLWRRDPLANLSHGATAMQVARFYYLLETGQLVSPEHSENMKAILANTQLRHKFARALLEVDPDATLYRKSGSWRTYHSDSALVEDVDRTYIAVALINHPDGGKWLIEIAKALDAIMMRRTLG